LWELVTDLDEPGYDLAPEVAAIHVAATDAASGGGLDEPEWPLPPEPTVAQHKGAPRPEDRAADISITEAELLVRDERTRIERALEAATLEERLVSGEVADESDGLADSASDTYALEAAHSIRAVLKLELAEIEFAEDRLADGTYGFCERCHAAIDRERLRAEPATRWCLADAVAVLG